MSPPSANPYDRLVEALGEPLPARCLAFAAERAADEPELAATAYDVAFAAQPEDETLQAARAELLDRLAVEEHGIRFRYIPAGPFVMGNAEGEADEQPPHRVILNDYWLAETPVSWETYCRLRRWAAPPQGFPPEAIQAKMKREDLWTIGAMNRLRLQYCEDFTLHARDWHAHTPDAVWTKGDEQIKARELFGEVDRSQPDAKPGYGTKPMICVPWEDARQVCEELAGSGCRYSLPTEAQWEKAARGGLEQQFCPWGNEAPTAGSCDCGRFEAFSILPSKQFAANGYGLFAMAGGVWEWTLDRYDSLYYAESPERDPAGPPKGDCRVLRGGSWSDAAAVVSNSYRMALNEGQNDAMSPTIGFRICRLRARGGSGGPASAAGDGSLGRFFGRLRTLFKPGK